MLRDGVHIAYQVYECPGRPTIVLMPAWSIVPARFWKLQVPYLSRHFRVVSFDGRGAGGSDRPAGAQAYIDDQYADDLIAVMDETGTDRAVLVGLSMGVVWALLAADRHPQRVLGIAAIGPACKLGVIDVARESFSFEARLDTTAGWAMYNRHFWLEGGYRAFLDFFFRTMFPEPHSTKQIEDGVGWGLEVSPATLADTVAGRNDLVDPNVESAAAAGIACPVLVLHGTDDRIRTAAIGQRLADLTGGTMLQVVGGGHGLPCREPVLVNHQVKRFAEDVTGSRSPAPRRWTRARSRQRRALYLSSPIGLGHARRDLAVAGQLRLRRPDLQIDWLAQHPVTALLAAAGESVHPASALLASESGHVEHESGDHDLHAFQAIRRMDETLITNFMVFDEVAGSGDYDLVIGDEAWDVDHFLHENPELKQYAFAWMTDFVGWLPMPDGGPAEAALTADYNAEMLEQRARFGRIRDRSIFVGDPEDIVPDSFGPGLPSIRTWTEEHFDFAGYVTGFDPPGPVERATTRTRLGIGEQQRLAVVTVGGSGVGEPMLRRVLDAIPQVHKANPDLQFLVVCGPRIDPRTLPCPPATTVLGYLPDLHLVLAAADIAVVQGGLTTCMELTASGTPFVYVPLQHHFEQQFHVRHRLQRYHAGVMIPYPELAPDRLAAELNCLLARPTEFRPVATDGAARAADLLAELI